MFSDRHSPLPFATSVKTSATWAPTAPWTPSLAMPMTPSTPSGSAGKAHVCCCYSVAGARARTACKVTGNIMFMAAMAFVIGLCSIIMRCFPLLRCCQLPGGDAACDNSVMRHLDFEPSLILQPYLLTCIRLHAREKQLEHALGMVACLEGPVSGLVVTTAGGVITL